MLYGGGRWWTRVHFDHRPSPTRARPRQGSCGWSDALSRARALTRQETDLVSSRALRAHCLQASRSLNNFTDKHPRSTDSDSGRRCGDVRAHTCHFSPTRPRRKRRLTRYSTRAQTCCSPTTGSATREALERGRGALAPPTQTGSASGCSRCCAAARGSPKSRIRAYVDRESRTEQSMAPGTRA